MNPLIRLPEHALLWDKIQSAMNLQRMPQALLLMGPRHVRVAEFARRLVWELLCQAADPCGQCAACHLLNAGNHPDFLDIFPDTKGGLIKIDQIRGLQEEVYLSPKCGNRRVILIDPADKMNEACANALLKILEEPPKAVHFILVVEQLGTLPATIMSRCSQMVFPDNILSSSHYLALGEHYPPESARAQLLIKQPDLIHQLCELIARKTSPCTVAAQWIANNDFIDLMWFLYLITAQAIQMRLQDQSFSSELNPMLSFAKLLHPVVLFNQLDVLNAALKKLRRNISLNETLVLENILMGYQRERE